MSVVIAVLNGARYFAQAIESVLAQTHRDLEIIAVDGGSTDGSLEIAAAYPEVRIVHQRGTGFAGAWNEGIAVARGDFFAILDSDDYWEPRKLERQMAVFAERPEVDYVTTRARFELAEGHECPPNFKPELLEGDYEANMPSATVVRREAFERVGPWPEEGMTIANDIEWYARAKDLPLELGKVDQCLVTKRVHNTNVSLSAESQRNYDSELLGILRRSVARSRS